MNDHILNEARRWIGTPYMHQASVRGQGADCLGLIRGIWREVIGPEPEVVPAYSSDWGEISLDEPLLQAASKWFDPCKMGSLQPGDVLLFRWKQQRVAKHCGILSTGGRFIHAYEKAGVVETELGPHWRKRIVACFCFPQITKQED